MALDDLISAWEDAFPVYVNGGIASSGPAKPSKKLVNKLGQVIADAITENGGGGGGGGDTSLTVRVNALEAIDAEDRLEALEGNADAAAPFVQAYRSEMLERPGDSPELFTDSYQGVPESTTATTLAPVTTAAGRVLQATAAGVLARRGRVRIEPNRKYLVRAVAQRIIDAGDPNNDAVQLCMAWFKNDGSPVSGTPTSVLATFSALTVVSGRTQKQSIIASASGDDIEVVAPATTVYGRPFLQTFGLGGLTNLEVLEVSDVTDSIGDAIAADLVAEAVAAAAQVALIETNVQSLRDDAAASAASAGSDLWSRPVTSIVASEPGSPSVGDRVLLNASNGTHPNQVAEYFTGAWHYSGAPKTGQILVVGLQLYRYAGAWEPALADFADFTGARAAKVAGMVSGQTVNILAASSSGKGGGRFRWDSTSTAPDDGGMVIRPTAISVGNAGRLIRADQSIRTPFMFGAAGNGSTDDSNALHAMGREWRILSITRSGTTATLTVENSNMLLDVGGTISITVKGMTQTEYNITATATIASANTVTFTVAGSPATPATFISGNSGRVSTHNGAEQQMLFDGSTHIVKDAWTPPDNCSIKANGAKLKLSSGTTLSGTTGSATNLSTKNVAPGWADGVYQWRISDPSGVAFWAANATVASGVVSLSAAIFDNSKLTVVAHGDGSIDVTNNYGSTLTLNWSARSANTPPAVMWVRNEQNIYVDGTLDLDANNVPEAQGLAISSGTSTALAQNNLVRFSHVIVRNTVVDQNLANCGASLNGGGGKGVTAQFKLGSVTIGKLETLNCDIGVTVEAADSSERQDYAFVIDDWYDYQCRRWALILTGNNPSGESTGNAGSFKKAFMPGVKINSAHIHDPQANNIVIPGDITTYSNYQVAGLIMATYATGYDVRNVKITSQRRVTIARGLFGHGNLHIAQAMFDISPEAVVDFNPVATSNPLGAGTLRGMNFRMEKLDVTDATSPTTALFKGLSTQKPTKGNLYLIGAGFAATDILSNIGVNVEFDILDVSAGSRVSGNTNVSTAPVFAAGQHNIYKSEALTGDLTVSGTIGTSKNNVKSLTGGGTADIVIAAASIPLGANFLFTIRSANGATFATGFVRKATTGTTASVSSLASSDITLAIDGSGNLTAARATSGALATTWGYTNMYNAT